MAADPAGYLKHKAKRADIFRDCAAPFTSNGVDIPQALKNIADQLHPTFGECWSAAQSLHFLLLKATQKKKRKKKITPELEMMRELLQATRRLTTGAENSRVTRSILGCRGLVDRHGWMDPPNLFSGSATASN